MKVYILSLPLHTNIGGILQTFALQKTLQNLGYDTYVIKRNLYGFGFKAAILRIRDKINDKIFNNIKIDKNSIFRHITGDLFAQSYYIRPFIRNNIKELYINDLKQYQWKDSDAIIVGSDQVWRMNFFNPILDAYLNFLGKSKIRRIAYAVSFGSSEINYPSDLILKCKPLLKNFSAISVREDTSIRVCKEVFSINSSLVLDPTMLLDICEYKKIASSILNKEKSFLFSYILDSSISIKEMLYNICNELKLSNIDFRNGDYIKPSVECFLANYLNCEYVVTDSFHGTVFALLFHKKFVSIANYNRGIDRFKSLLSLVGLSNRLIDSNKIEDVMYILKDDINWDDVDRKIMSLKINSIKLLKENL
ncbi:polysaccharide pyruvyl transferase family protein [Xylanibacter oryzae]|uniref:polysaccharide pyruvyl transferase family protein n=1 Tax=Xylanibacter oryzae TaxID=185293 RepID=UPI0004B00097|nr:polysaccharide pyruvyl transferase family protein [Xylanibacter oryzae]